MSSPNSRGDPVAVTLRWPLAAAVVGACITVGGPVVLEEVITYANRAIMIPETVATETNIVTPLELLLMDDDGTM